MVVIVPAYLGCVDMRRYNGMRQLCTVGGGTREQRRFPAGHRAEQNPIHRRHAQDGLARVRLHAPVYNENQRKRRAPRWRGVLFANGFFAL